jgi:hypothetical protein
MMLDNGGSLSGISDDGREEGRFPSATLAAHDENNPAIGRFFIHLGFRYPVARQRLSFK